MILAWVGNFMLKIRTNINIITILFFLFALPYGASLYITDNNILKKLFLLGKIGVLLILCIYILFVKRRISLPAVLIIAMQIYLLIVTFFRLADVRRCLSTILPILGIILLYDIGFGFPKEFVKSQYFLFYFLIILNFISELLFPDGMYCADLTGYTQYWILGYYNNHTLAYIPAICFSLLYRQLYNKKLGPDLLILITIVSALLVKSGGVVFTLGIILMFLCFLKYGKWTINYYWAWSIHVIFFFFILIMKNRKVIDLVILVADFIFNKSKSFTARYHLWGNALDYIRQKLIWGHGIESQMKRLSEYGWGLHTHNFVLEILHQGGIIYAGMFIILVIIVGKRISKCQNLILRGSLIIPILGWIVDTLMEPFMTAFLLVLLVLAYHYKDIEKDVNIMRLY